MAEGLLLNSDGEATADPAVMFHELVSALLPFGDVQGKLMCELLAEFLPGMVPSNRKPATGRNRQQHD